VATLFPNPDLPIIHDLKLKKKEITNASLDTFGSVKAVQKTLFNPGNGKSSVQKKGFGKNKDAKVLKSSIGIGEGDDYAEG